MTDAYTWTIDHGVVAWDDYHRKYKRTQYKCDDPVGVSRFYNKGAHEEENTSNNRLKEILTQ